MIRKQRVLIGSLTLVFLLLATSTLSRCIYGDKYTINTLRHEEACRTITEGCTRAYVEECVRVPPGNYNTCDYLWEPTDLGFACLDHYVFDGYRVAVRYDEDTDIVDFVLFEEGLRIPNKLSSVIPWW